jgi:hypothetical protein
MPYVKALPPSEPYFYHGANYTGLRMIAETHKIVPNKTISIYRRGRISLTTTIAGAHTTLAGLVRVPRTPGLDKIAIPNFYIARDLLQTYKYKILGYQIFRDIPNEYSVIWNKIVHNIMFIDENEYTVLADELWLPADSIIYIKRQMIKKLRKFVTARVVNPVDTRDIIEIL